ncbi:MAG: hypothetical protein ACQET7_01545 [Thermodesulfobacteriota bacterium]
MTHIHGPDDFVPAPRPVAEEAAGLAGDILIRMSKRTNRIEKKGEIDLVTGNPAIHPAMIEAISGEIGALSKRAR